jgi:hypothetical protein
MYGVPAQGSGLWIAFDSGAATLPANALSANDNPGYAAQNSFTNFIGAIDPSGYFTKLTFFGDGFGIRGHMCPRHPLVAVKSRFNRMFYLI